MKNHPARAALGAAFLGVAAALALHADVKMPAIFGDHMVLQEGEKLPVWGTADPGEKVTVTVGTETGEATADGSGQWRVDLAALPAQAAATTLTVAGKNSLTFSDVLVGEVWICSGQSNMEFGINMDSRGKETVAQANEPEIRLFLVPKVTSLQPLSDIKVPDGLTGKWQVCTPQTLGGAWGWNGFSAVGYYFGKEIHEATGKPVGLIGTYWGGTPAQSWVSLTGLEKDPGLKYYVDRYEQNLAGFAQATANYPAALADYQAKSAAWKAQYGQAYGEQMRAWGDAARGAIAAGQTPPPRPAPPAPMPHEPAPPDGGPYASTNLYNGMIAPLIPFAIKGAIWYQGEANAGGGYNYRTLFPRLISDWREKWGEGDFPFLFVQLASFQAGPDPCWPYLREAQAMTLSLPKTGMATAVDIGDPNNIHPVDKLDVGHRLALVAEDVAYGQSVVDGGPVYGSMQVDGSTAKLSFTQEGGGLVIGQAPWTAPNVAPLPTDKLAGFTIAGQDKNWVPAEATIEGDSVSVSSPQVPAPAAVRYDWANAPRGNLYNKEGLPAFPFRTDDWMDPAAMGPGTPAK